MVHLSLSSTKGNQGLRYFPHSGYLGLTPVRVEGVVRTKLDADQKYLPSRSLTISVRCYETRTGRVNNVASNILVDYTQVLWSKPDAVEYENVGALEYPFRITIPIKVSGNSTAIFVDYRCTWRVEAVLNHIPITGVGSRQIRHFELPLVRYDIPAWLLPPSRQPHLSQVTNRPRAPKLRYSVHAPTSPIGPLDLVSIPIHLLPLDPGVSIRSASAIVERRITLLDPSHPTLRPSSSRSVLATSTPSAHPPSPSTQNTHPDHDPLDSASSKLSLNSSNQSTLTPNTFYPSSTPSLPATESTPLIPSLPNSPLSSPPLASSSSKVIVNPITGTESSGSFVRDSNGVFNKTLTLQWPAAKSHSRWAIGETVTTDIVSVKYFVRTKVIITSSSGTETLELDDEELTIVSTNDTERQLALAKYRELQDTGGDSGPSRSKSKSPRRSRPEEDNQPGTSKLTSWMNVPPPSPWVRSSATKTTSPIGSNTRASKSSSSLRPHTSAGPRDKPVDFAGGAYGRTRGGGRGEGSSSRTNNPTAVGEDSNDRGPNATSSAKRRSEVVVMRTSPMTTSRPDSRDSTYHTTKRQALAKLVGSGGSGGNSGTQLKSAKSSKLSSSSFWSTVHSNGVTSPRMKGNPSGSSTSTTASLSSASSGRSGGRHSPRNGQSRSRASGSVSGGESVTSDPPSEDHMKEWESELAKIEMRSRKSSDLLGFAARFRKKLSPKSSSPAVVVRDGGADED